MSSRFPLLLSLFLGGITAWLWGIDHVMRSVSVIILLPLWLLSLGLWWSAHKKGVRLKRLAVVVVCFAAFFVVFRYDGSADGSALPSLTWRWHRKITRPVLHNISGSSRIPSTVPEGVADMPRFLGSRGDGVLPEPNWQTDWKTHPPREVWRIAVGEGWSGFAVAGSRAITQEQRGSEECVTCYDIATGKLLWAHADEARFDETMGGIGPRATPTIDVIKGVVFTLGAQGLLNCLDLTTGVRLWSQNVLSSSGATTNLKWGKSSSPLIVGDTVVCSGGENGASLVAYRCLDGQAAWKSGTDGGSYSSPVLMTLAGRVQIVTVNANSVSGHDSSTGILLWQFEWAGMYPKVGQPVQVGPDRILITSSYGLKSVLLDVKGSANGKITVAPLWKSSAPRTKFSSAGIFGAHAYALDEGTLCCVSLVDGKRCWREGRLGFGQQIRVGDDWLLMQAEKGFVALIKPNPERFDEVSRFDALHSKTWNPPTLAGRWLLVRNDTEAVCFELPAK